MATSKDNAIKLEVEINKEGKKVTLFVPNNTNVDKINEAINRFKYYDGDDFYVKELKSILNRALEFVGPDGNIPGVMYYNLTNNLYKTKQAIELMDKKYDSDEYFGYYHVLYVMQMALDPLRFN